MFAVLFVALTVRPMAQQRQLTVERITSLPSLIGTASTDPVWSPDSKRLAFLWNDKALPFRDVWVIPADGGVPTQITDMARDFPYPPTVETGAPKALAQHVAARARGGVADLVWTPDGQALVFMYRGDLFRVSADSTGLKRLTQSGGAKHSFAVDPDVPDPRGTALTFSPDGRFVSFLRDGDLWWYIPATNKLTQATRIAVPPSGVVPGGRFYQPDVGVSSFKWSPDSRHIAVHLNDRRRVRKVLIPNYLGEEVVANAVRRDFPGDYDHVRTMGIFSVEAGHIVRTLALEDNTDRFFANYRWSPDGKSLLIDQNSPDAIHRWIYVVSADTGTVRELWHDYGTPRVTQFWTSEWQTDGKGIVLVSDFEGRHHLYSLPLTGGTPKALTQGEWSVVGRTGTAKVEVSSATRQVFFISTKKNPYERQVYRIPETGGPITQVTSLPGSHVPFVSPDGSKVALLHSSDVTPTELYIVEAGGGTPERRITHSPPKEFYDTRWIQPRYVTFKSHDGFTLHGRLLEPPNPDRFKKYPAVLGPVYLDTVRNEWRGVNSTLQQYMALEGQYIGLLVDIRGSTGYGRKFRESLVGNYGGFGDIEDLYSGVKYLQTLGYVDPKRIGIWGSSYGGMLTVTSLFQKPGVYKAGVAGAPCVYLPHFLTHDVRRITRPETHPDFFHDRSPLIYGGENLQDHLMIIHGMQDDVVLFQDTVALAEKLMMLGKDFDFVFAPSAVHGWSQKDYYATYLYRKLVDHFDRYLGHGPRPAAPTQER